MESSGGFSSGSSDTPQSLSTQISTGDMATGGPALTAPEDLWDVSQQEVSRRKTKRLQSASCSCIDLHENVDLTPMQHEALGRVVQKLDTDNASVVVTNPLQQDNPIVFVTRQWEQMCGFSYNEAVGRNARLTQGSNSDTGVMRQISSALKQQRSCKVMMLNYRGGLSDRPFWNMLTISPIVHRGSLMLYLANLQDYTYHMATLVSMSPTQFCRSADHHQRTLRVPQQADDQLHLRFFARPGIIEVDESAASTVESTLTQAPIAMKRLGWSNLLLEPEHLTDRVMDALRSLDAQCERLESVAGDDDVFVVNANVSGVACRVVITRDANADGAFSITCTRLGGDTFAYHEAFRNLKRLLGDAVHGGTPLMSGAARVRGGGPRFGLAPMPRLAMMMSGNTPTDGGGEATFASGLEEVN